MNFQRFLSQLFSANKIVALMYHRVADVDADPWQLAVSPANFESHIQHLAKHYKVITPGELVAQLKQGKLRQRQVCVTFDDGYMDNYLFAKPILEKYQCPATFFISSYFVEKAMPFWWDELQEIILSTPKLPSPFLFELNHEQLNCKTENEGVLDGDQVGKQAKWVWSDKPPTMRCFIYFWLWERLRLMPQLQIESFLDRLRVYTGVQTVNMKNAIPMTRSQLKETADSTSINIGLHTHTHPVLSNLSYEIQKQELLQNKDFLEELCGYKMTTISFPHGKYNADTLSTVKSLNLQAAFTTVSNVITARSPLHEMGRFQILNWSADKFCQILNETFH